MREAKLSAAPLHSFCGLVHISEQYVPAQPPGPIDMDELEKDIINQDNSNKGVLPLEPVD